MATFDRMDWHYDGDFPDNLPPENGGTHIGMYLTWIIQNDLIGDLHREDSQEEIQKVINKELTGRDFLIEMCDEKFWDDDLNNEGIAFTEFYYEPKSEDSLSYYLEDYCETLGNEVESLYEIENTWDNYEKLKPIIDQRYFDWKNKK